MGKILGYTKHLFVTTHSPFSVNALQSEQVWFLEKKDDGFSAAKQAYEYNFVSGLVREGTAIANIY